MATDSKEQVTEQKLKKIRQVQKKLMSPLPAKLKQLAEPAAIKLLGEKMQQVPEFIDFHPLDEMDWKPLADVENSQQAETLRSEEVKLGETIREKISDRKSPSPLFEQSETAIAGNRKTSKSRDQKKLPSALKSIQTVAADKQAAVADNLKSGAKPTATKLKQRRKLDQIGPKSKPHRSFKSTPQTLAVLLEKIASLGQSLDPSIPAIAGTRSGNKDKALIAEPAARPNLGNAKTKRLKPSKKQKLESLIDKSKPAGKSKKTASPALKKSNKNLSSALQRDDSSGLGLLSELIDSLWRQQSQGRAVVSPSGTAVAAALSTPPADASNPTASTQASVAAALALPEIDVRPAAIPVPADAAPSSAPSLNQAEELAEQINRVIREQAWLRGINLP